MVQTAQQADRQAQAAAPEPASFETMRGPASAPTAQDVAQLRVSPVSPHDDNYRVQTGDTLFSLARGIRQARLVLDKTEGQLVESLRSFLGSDHLRPGTDISISGLLDALASGSGQFTPVPQATYGHSSYTVKPGDTLFSILRSYRDTLPGGERFALQRGADVSEHIATCQRLRRLELKLADNQRLPPIRPGDRIMLERIFSRSSLERTRRQEHSEGTAPGTSPRRQTQAQPSQPLPEADVLRMCRNVSQLLREDGYQISVQILMGLAMQESSFRPGVKSAVNARGLVAVRSTAAKEVWNTDMKRRYGSYTAELMYNPEACLHTGGRYLGKLMQRFGNLADALAAYNNGPTRWEGRLADSAAPEQEAQRCAYVQGVLGHARRYAEKHGLIPVAAVSGRR